MREPAKQAGDSRLESSLIESGFTLPVRCRPLRGLIDRCVRSYLGLTPRALCCRQLRWLGPALMVLGIVSCTTASPVLSQSNQSAAAASQTNSDATRYAVIINGASGEPAYAKQFQQWTAALGAALSGRF